MHSHWQEILQKQLYDSPLRGGRQGFWLTSRVHALAGWSNQVWIKRDDELGPFGSKWRKMQGLTVAIQEQKADAVLAWGGSRSQHLLGLVQLGREFGWKLRLLVKEGSPRQDQGPDLFWPLLTRSACIEMLSRKDWPQVEHLARERFAAMTAEGHRVFVVPEGGAQIEALWGSLTLPLDIHQQEKELGRRFSRVFVDAGTGLTAQALIIGLGLLESETLCEVLLCAGSSATFTQDLQRRREELAVALRMDIPLARFRCHEPETARSFGSTNRAVFQEIIQTADETGVLLEPIYSAKLMMNMRALQKEWSGDETILFIHSGGTNNLLGFPHALQSLIF